MKARAWLGVILLLVAAPGAWALTGTPSEIVIQDGEVGIVDPLAVAKGGTGAASLTGFAVVMGNGTGAVTTEGPGTGGQPLVSNGAGTNPTFQALPLADADAVTGVLPFGNGGTGQSTAPDDNVLVGNGSGWELKTLTDCDGATDAVTYDTTTNEWNCHTITSGVAPLLTMSTLGDITATNTVYITPSAVDVTETRARQIAPLGLTFNNLRCVSSVPPGGSDTFTITMRDGACGSETGSANQICTISAAATSCAAATVGEAVTAGDCFSWSVVASATATSAVVNCAVERTG